MASLCKFLYLPKACMTSQLNPLTLIQRHLIHDSCGSRMKSMSPSLSKSCISISSGLKSTTVIWHSSCSIGLCDLPPLGFEGSSPGSCPGCQVGDFCDLNVVTVADRVIRRFKMGDIGSFDAGSDSIDVDVPTRLSGEGRVWSCTSLTAPSLIRPASRSKCA